MEMEFSTWLILAAIALLAGFFDAIAGGGGLLTLPALFIAGIDPLAAMATNKFQASSASASAVWAFARKHMIQWRTGWPMAALSFAGGVAGALSISMLDRTVLEVAVPILLIAVAAYFALSPKLGDQAGARCAIYFGPRLVKPLLITVCCLMAMKLLLGEGHPVGEWFL
jgi:uncharacterized membrane protein YfcA